MEINITKFVNDAAPMDYSASVAEIGQNAGPDTWNAACTDAPDWNFLDSPEKLDCFREWLKPWGAWDASEIAAFSDIHLNALFIQWIAGDMRECGIDANCDWAEIETAQSEGCVSSNIFRAEDGSIYFSLDH